MKGQPHSNPAVARWQDVCMALLGLNTKYFSGVEVERIGSVVFDHAGGVGRVVRTLPATRPMSSSAWQAGLLNAAASTHDKAVIQTIWSFIRTVRHDFEKLDITRGAVCQ